MAIKPKKHKRFGRLSSMTARISVSRTSKAGSRAFESCVILRNRDLDRRDGMERRRGCAFGRNPRIALARAMRQLAGRLIKRSGSFAGI